MNMASKKVCSWWWAMSSVVSTCDSEMSPVVVSVSFAQEIVKPTQSTCVLSLMRITPWQPHSRKRTRIFLKAVPKVHSLIANSFASQIFSKSLHTGTILLDFALQDKPRVAFEKYVDAMLDLLITGQTPGIKEVIPLHSLIYTCF